MGGCKMDDVGEVDEVPLVTGSADAVDGVLQDDMAEEEVAQRLEDLSMHESVKSKVVVNDSQVICQTTVLVTNAAGLIEKTGNKFKAFHRMVKNLDPKPDIIVVHELGWIQRCEDRAQTCKGADQSQACWCTPKI